MSLKVDSYMELQNKILEQHGVFQRFFDYHPDGIILMDMNGQMVDANADVLNIFGYTKEELLEIPLKQLMNGTADNSRQRLAIPHKQGQLLYVNLTVIPLMSEGKEVGKMHTFEDITQYLKQNRGLLNIQEMFTLISEKSQNIISSFSSDGMFTYISPTVTALLGYTPEEVIGQPQINFNHPDDYARLLDTQNTYHIDKDTVRFTGRVLHKNGEYRWYETTVEVIRDEPGNILQKIGVGRDVTERKEAEELISHLAYRDSVTELPNRRLFKQKVQELLDDSKQQVHGLMLIDLDGFKFVNDNFGHEIGDQLLIEVANRLSAAIGNKGLVARWGGDEFTVICANIENKANLQLLMENIKRAISAPLIIEGKQLKIGASIGLSISIVDGDSVELLIKKADAEMYRAKNQLK